LQMNLKQFQSGNLLLLYFFKQASGGLIQIDVQ
jgi:hypothetical protein